jgi:site-specific DNA-methyltransferase (adenine-specific)
MEYINKIFNEDCIIGSKKYLPNNSIDLIITDPPYGIDGDKLDKHYNRNENNVLDGYIEVSKEEYPEFSKQWIKEAERVLKPGGCLYLISGYSNLRHILNALSETNLIEINHIIWKYNFGVYTKLKYVSSHYHILYYQKKGKKTFNTYCRYSDSSECYRDREDVWIINREYHREEIKNKNQLPKELLKKMILYSSNEGDIICDFFLGSFSTIKVAKELNRKYCGFEKNKIAFDYFIDKI